MFLGWLSYVSWGRPKAHRWSVPTFIPLLQTRDMPHLGDNICPHNPSSNIHQSKHICIFDPSSIILVNAKWVYNVIVDLRKLKGGPTIYYIKYLLALHMQAYNFISLGSPSLSTTPKVIMNHDGNLGC